MSAESILFPRLMTAFQGPLSILETNIVNDAIRIEAWFSEQFRKTPALMTTSVDLRNAGSKLAPVDTNIFPAGFNNLNPEMVTLCTAALKAAILKTKPGCLRVLILPESHTRNLFYMKSLCVLRDCLLSAGFSVHIGSLDETLTAPIEIEISTDQHVLIEPLKRRGDTLFVGEYEPCLILLNHDLSTGLPKILQAVSQPIYPAAALGWSHRLKSNHFSFFNQVAREFAALLHIDSWLINPLFRAVEGVDFMQQTGLEDLAVAADDVLSRVKLQYEKYGIKEKPFVAIKADNGTYGMGVMMVHSGDELLQLNRRMRTRMASRKGGQNVTQVLIQEGVYSIETMANHAVAEPVVYLIGQFVVGGFYRIHQDREAHENLNTPGMYFEPLEIASPAFEAYALGRKDNHTDRFYVYGVVARLAALAAARESAVLD